MAAGKKKLKLRVWGKKIKKKGKGEKRLQNDLNTASKRIFKG